MIARRSGSDSHPNICRFCSLHFPRQVLNLHFQLSLLVLKLMCVCMCMVCVHVYGVCACVWCVLCVWVCVNQHRQDQKYVEMEVKTMLIGSVAQVTYQRLPVTLQEVGVWVGILQCVATLQETRTSVHTLEVSVCMYLVGGGGGTVGSHRTYMYLQAITILASFPVPRPAFCCLQYGKAGRA